MGYITVNRSYIESDNLIFDIEPNIYIIPGLAETADLFFEAAEDALRLSSGDGKYYVKKTCIYVRKDGRDNLRIETGRSYNSSTGDNDIETTPGEVFVTNINDLIGSMAIAIARNHAVQDFNYFISSGLQRYTVLKVMNTLAVTDPDHSVLADINNLKTNASVDLSILLSQPMDFWMNDPSVDYTKGFSNGCAGVSFRLMGFLDERYGNYTAWLESYDEKCNDYLNDPKNSGSFGYVRRNDLVKITYDSILETYGNTVYDDFYAWLPLHSREYDYFHNYSDTADVSTVTSYTIYPSYERFNNLTRIGFHDNIIHNDLTVDIMPAEYYLREYKHEDTSGLILKLSPDAEVELYDTEDKLIGTASGPEIQLNGVGSVKLKGTGTTKFTIEGYRIYNYY